MKRIAVLEDYQEAAAKQPYWARLAGRATVDFFKEAIPEEALPDRIADYEIVVPIRERTRFPASVLSRLPGLELLALTGRQSGHVDVAAATARGIVVAETEGSGAAAVELTMAMIMAAARGIAREDQAVRQGGWQQGIGIELAGKTLGILGLGRIGRRIAAFARLLGMSVIAWGPTLTPERAEAEGATFVPLDDLFARADIVTVHLRLSDKTHHVVSAAQLARMKPTALFVNTARGGLVDEQALVTTLQQRRIRGAALDVYEVEPLPGDHPLRSMDHVVLSPHMGYVTEEAYDMFFSQAVENIGMFLDGRQPNGTLNPEALRARGGRRSQSDAPVSSTDM